MSSQEESKFGIVLVAYGSLSAKARGTYDEIKVIFEAEFPGAKVEIAFTGDVIRKRLAVKGILIPNPLTALANLQDRGCKEVVVQFFHIAPAGEFHDLAGLVRGLNGVGGTFGFKRLDLGMPLLASKNDCERVSLALTSQFGIVGGASGDESRDPKKVAVVLMGHGTNHPGDSTYALMARILERDHQNVFLGTLDGFWGVKDVLEEVKSSGAKRIKLMPFLLVAGAHALKDMAGEKEESWARLFEEAGFKTDVNVEGLGEDPKIIKVFVDHAKTASGDSGSV